MKAFIFRSAVKSVRYEVFETIINIYCRFICLCGDEFIVIILNVHIDIANYVLSARFKNKRGMLCKLLI
jgi:hypothetical protein